MAEAAPVNMMAVIAPAVGWLIPGAGHMIQKRWIRGLLLMVSRRRSLLGYLRGRSPERYKTLITSLGIRH